MSEFKVTVESAWKFSWNPMIGVMYGPIPIGLIIAIPLLMLLYSSK